MIRSYFGITKDPFEQNEQYTLLEHQQEVFEILQHHCQQGGLCVIVGEPGTGKSVLRTAIQNHDKKHTVTPTVGRTMHTYSTILRILCESFEIEPDGAELKCERRVIEEAFRINRVGKRIAIMIEEAHLMHIQHLRKLRLLLQEFPSNYCLILFAQSDLIDRIRLTANQDIHSRLTYSAVLYRLGPEQTQQFILDQFDLCGLPHNTITDDAMALISRSTQGNLRFVKILTKASLVEAVRAQTRSITINEVNKALMQPHWRQREQWGENLEPKL